jgi:chemotaxis protein MotD
VTSITATVQKPSPKPDREIGPSHAEGDLQKSPASEPTSRFGAMMRAVSKAAATPRSETDAHEADEPDGAVGEGEGADAASEAVLPFPPGPTDATALLANILSAALATASPASDTVDGTSAPVPPSDTSRSGAQGVLMAAGTGATASSAGSSAGSGPNPDVGVGVGRTEAAGRAPPAGDGLGSPPKIAVLDRAVHFKPVRTALAQRVPTLAASPALAPPGTADAATQSDQTGLPEPIALRLQPARLGGADGVTDKPQPGVVGLPGQHVEAAANVVPGLQTEPETRATDGAARTAATGLDRDDIAARADSPALFGIAKTIREATDRRMQDNSPVAGAQDRPGTGQGLPAASLPTIAAAIKDEIDRAGSIGSETRVAGDPAVKATPDGPLRTLRIQLRPEELGTVTVELRLANGQLETHLRASRPETAALLHRDSAMLTDLLKQAHYQASVTVSQGRPADGGNWAGGAPSQGQPSFADGGARPGQGGDRQRQAEQPLPADRREGERTDETVRPRDGGVYL